MLCPECGKKMILDYYYPALVCPGLDWTDDECCQGKYELRKGVDYVKIGDANVTTLVGLERILSEEE